MAETRTNEPRAVGAGFAAYLLWAVFPLYFEALHDAAALEIVAHRVTWTFVFCALGVTVLGAWGQVRTVWRNKPLVGRLALAGALVTLNWLIYVWAVLNDQVVDAALGYFINPLVTVGLGLVVLRERLQRLQYLALGVGAVAVAVIIVGYGHVPWVGLGLAFTFGLYALMKNRVGLRATPVVGLGFEVLALAPLAVGYIVVLEVTGRGQFTGHGAGYTLGLALTGVVTALPLLFFAFAAARVPLATMGMLQYVTPIGQFLLGVLVFHEAMPLARWLGFGLVWVALILLTLHGVRSIKSRGVG
ncbi:MAG: EamA family transporter RarD [Propionibacteriaceae bacterium]|jgi:chloramphenicol-sensitive protein RarD|nr:EamA family transporter RarD [Propionibacteriaceae bacterium]